ncbi:uncharacterized protein LOC120323743 [Pipra filicauda]|uniref:Uncharacterized protein LOC120323743 n=1 Tax=Pipra filicauda TaxID=649802 RepID=A0A7R5KTM5_9PASS|nr:uncharacterized protein LOC120323743 [Pipra filicauda]
MREVEKLPGQPDKTPGQGEKVAASLLTTWRLLSGTVKDIKAQSEDIRMLLDTIIRRNRVKRESSGVEGSRSGTTDHGAGPGTTERPRQHERGASVSAVHIQDDRRRQLQCESTADRAGMNFTNTMTEFHLKTFPAFHLNGAAGLRCTFVAVFTALGACAAVLSEYGAAPGSGAVAVVAPPAWPRLGALPADTEPGDGGIARSGARPRLGAVRPCACTPAAPGAAGGGGALFSPHC